MIYRVGDKEHPGYDYSRQKPTQISGDSEKFSLDHRKEEDFSSNKKEKGEDKKLHEKPGVDIRKQGVRLELSGKEESGEQTEKRDVRANGNTPMSGSLLTLFKDLFQSVKDFLYKLWNEPSEETVISEDVTPEEAERYTEEYYALKGIDPKVREAERDEKIRKQLRSGNLEQVISLLTDDGRRTMAKNSTLLTYYDKSGKLTQLSASDKERILHGDRHVREL